jgi:hypothetical protein
MPKKVFTFDEGPTQEIRGPIHDDEREVSTMKTAKVVLFAAFLVCSVTFLSAQEDQTIGAEGTQAVKAQEVQAVEVANPAAPSAANATDAAADEASGYQKQQDVAGNEYNYEPAVQTDYTKNPYWEPKDWNYIMANSSGGDGN